MRRYSGAITAATIILIVIVASLIGVAGYGAYKYRHVLFPKSSTTISPNGQLLTTTITTDVSGNPTTLVVTSTGNLQVSTSYSSILFTSVATSFTTHSISITSAKFNTSIISPPASPISTFIDLLGNFSKMTASYLVGNIQNVAAYSYIGRATINSSLDYEVALSISPSVNSTLRQSAVAWIDPSGNVSIFETSGQNYTGFTATYKSLDFLVPFYDLALYSKDLVGNATNFARFGPIAQSMESYGNLSGNVISYESSASFAILLPAELNVTSAEMKIGFFANSKSGMISLPTYLALNSNEGSFEFQLVAAELAQ